MVRARLTKMYKWNHFSDMPAAIETSKLTKVYKLAHGGGKTAVDALDLTVNPGEIFGFLGPNGAGKTSTIKMLLGFICPSSGGANLLGRPIDDPQARSEVGYLPEQPYFHKFMSPREIIATHAALVGVPRRERRTHVDEIIENLGLKELARTPVANMSKGQVQRVGIGQALVGNPKLLILDEPASGLDPLGRYQMRDLLLKQRGQGRTIFLSSHLLSEIETVCDRVAVLSHGKLVALGPPSEIKQSSKKVSITTTELPVAIEARLSQLGASARFADGEAVISVEQENVYELIDFLKKAGLPLVSVTPERETLEQAFLRLAA
jgi:ABC-2 type transport system ATP-binding protein